MTNNEEATTTTTTTTTSTTTPAPLNTKPSSVAIRTMEEAVQLFDKIIVQHYIDDEIRQKKETEEWEQGKKERAEKRERFKKKQEEKEKLKREKEEQEEKERLEKSADEETTAAKSEEKEVTVDDKKKAEEKEEEDEDDIPDEVEFEKHRDFILKRRPPPRSNHEMRKQLFRLVKSLISTSINSEPSKVIASNPAMDELLSVSCEYCVIFRDVGMAVVICSFACNICAHLGARNLIDATNLVHWFLEVALLFNALKRVVHLCLLGISNAAMCKDLRLNDKMAKDFAASICRLHGESRVVEAWSCAIINLVGTSKTGNGAILLKHDVFSMLQRMVTIHGTDDATASRGIQALTCLSLVHFPGKPAAGNNNNAASGTTTTNNASLANSVNGSPQAKAPPAAAAAFSAAPPPMTSVSNSSIVVSKN